MHIESAPFDDSKNARARERERKREIEKITIIKNDFRVTDSRNFMTVPIRESQFENDAKIKLQTKQRMKLLTNAHETTKAEKSQMPNAKTTIRFLFQPFGLIKITVHNFTFKYTHFCRVLRTLFRKKFNSFQYKWRTENLLLRSHMLCVTKTFPSKECERNKCSEFLGYT